MWLSLVLCFLAGVMGGNGFPHFVKGITKEDYPNVMGNSPIPNFLAGWSALIITVLLVVWAQPALHPLESLIGGALGVLVMGLFHAWHGAVGKKS